MAETVSLWEIKVPTVYNDGRPVRTRHHRAWDAKVRVISGGLSIFKPAKGQWVSQDGKLFIDRVIPVQIACTEKQINRIADITAKHYLQLAIFVFKISTDVKVIHYDPNKKYIRQH